MAIGVPVSGRGLLLDGKLEICLSPGLVVFDGLLFLQLRRNDPHQVFGQSPRCTCGFHLIM